MLLFKGRNNVFRNHRKFIIIDHKTVLTGGRNIGDEYFDLSSSFNFLDREIVFSGDLSLEVQKSFNEIWDSKHAKANQVLNSEELYRKTNPRLTHELYAQFHYELFKVSKAIDNADKKISPELYTIGKNEWEKSHKTSCDNFQMVTEKSLSKKKDTRNVARAINAYLNNKITNAQKSIIIDPPYFTFDDKNQQAFNLALDNNVSVELITNGGNNTNVKISVAFVNQLIRDWFKKGIKFHLYNGELPENYPGTVDQIEKASFNALHAKTFIFDDRDIIIGTYNFDFYSAKYNNEVIFECQNAPRDFVDHVVQNIEKRKERSHTIATEKEIESISSETLVYKALKALAGSLYETVVN